jgi:hypothetical protein
MTEHISLRIMVTKAGEVRVMFYNVVDGQVAGRENWGTLARKTPWTPRQTAILSDIDAVTVVQWRDGRWKHLLGETA